MDGIGNVSNRFVIIGQHPETLDFWFHERENNNGQPGKIVLMGDGQGDVRGMVNRYVDEGYDPDHIVYNGLLVSDVFTKTTDESGKVVFKGHGRVVKNEDNARAVRQVIETQSGVRVNIPVMMGSETKVKPLSDGTYKVVSRPVIPEGGHEKVEILTEAELIEKFSKYSSEKKLDVIA